MECKKVKRKLLAFMDGELKEGEERRIRAHFRSCPSCEKERREFSSLWEFLLKLKPVEPPPYLIQRTITEVTTAREKMPWWQGILLKPAPVVATIVIGLLVGGFLSQSIYSSNYQTGDEFVSSIYLDSLADFPQGSPGKIIFVEGE